MASDYIKLETAYKRKLAAKDERYLKCREELAATRERRDECEVKMRKAFERVTKAEQKIAAKDDERLTIVANYENVIAAKDAEIAKLREKMGDDDLLKMARDIDAKDAEIRRLKLAVLANKARKTKAYGEARIKAKDAEIKELRECLKDACNTELSCRECKSPCYVYTQDDCPIKKRWRKALEGANDDR